MSKLYPRQDVVLITGPDGTEYVANEDGSFDFPDDFASVLQATHVAGEKSWEDDAEREARLIAAERARRRDPAELLAAVERLGGFDEPKDAIVSDAFADATPAELRALAKELTARANKLDPPKPSTRRKAPAKAPAKPAEKAAPAKK